MNYEKEILIDKENLDLEWLKQPSLVLQAYEQYANAQYELDTSKEALEITIANVDMEVRAMFEASGKKTTEKMIESQVTIDARVTDAKERVSKAKQTLALCDAARKGFEHKKSALEHLTYMQRMAIYAENSNDIEARGIQQEQVAKEAREKIKQAQKGA